MKGNLMLVLIITLVVVASPFGPTAAAPRCYPTSRFAVLSGGMVRDTLTQLVWQQDGSGTRATCSSNDSLTCMWAEAQAYCAALDLGGFAGWRLPTFKELLSIVDYTVGYPGPTINQTAFPNTPADAFWASSQSPGSPDYAWNVDFTSGASGNPYVGYYWRVRCVR